MGLSSLIHQDGMGHKRCTRGRGVCMISKRHISSSIPVGPHLLFVGHDPMVNSDRRGGRDLDCDPGRGPASLLVRCCCMSKRKGLAWAMARSTRRTAPFACPILIPEARLLFIGGRTRVHAAPANGRWLRPACGPLSIELSLECRDLLSFPTCIVHRVLAVCAERMGHGTDVCAHGCLSRLLRNQAQEDGNP